MYKADLGDVSLRVPEAKAIAKLLLKGLKKADFIKKIQDENILHYTNIGRAKRQAFTIRSRLESVDKELWQLIAKCDFATATQATLVATLKRSSLLFDFFRLEIIPLVEERVFELPRYHWKKYIDECRLRDPTMTKWSPNTIKRMGSTLYKILYEAEFVKNTRKPVLNRILVTPEVTRYLTKQREREILYLLTWKR